MRPADAIKADCARVKDWLTGLWTHVEANRTPMVQQLAHDALDLLSEVERLRARLAECGPGIERLRDLQQAYAGGGDYMRQLLEALEVKLPTKEPS